MDLAIAGFIANVAGGLVGVVVAYVFYRVAPRRPIASRWKRWTRGCLVMGPAGPSLTALIPGVHPDTPEQTAPEVPSGDSATLDTLTASVQSLVAGNRLNDLEGSVRFLQHRNGELADEVKALQEKVNNPSIWRMTRATANDFGLTIGWIGLYFTLFLAWWNGRTPGKYLLGMRVVRLSGEPLALWFAFDRFGGYAAGIATGLLGFVQLYWDPNPQGIHDRVARTVVIRTRPASSSDPESQ